MPDVINKVMSFISRDGEGDSDKDVLLKQLVKDISQNKYAKFYRARQQEADVSLGQYFFSVYKIVYPLKLFLEEPAREAKIKQVTLEAFLDKKTMDLIKQLSPEGIAELKRNGGADISKQLEDDLNALCAGFDNPKIAMADKCYNLIAYMKQFVFLDFSSLLKKFDPEMMESDFLTQPKFVPVDINVLVADLSLFLSVLPFSEEEDDWKTVFEILKYCKGGTDVISPAQWNSLLVSLKDLKQSKIIELMAKLGTGNPVLVIKPKTPHENLSASWLEQKTKETREIISGISESQKSVQISNIAQTVFGPLATIRLNYLTPEKGNILLDKGLSSYIYAQALNYLAAFIQEYMSKEIQELCDILLVRGQWTKNAASREMSDGFHTILDIAGEITELDESLSEDGSNGPRIRGALLRVDRDKGQARYINNIIEGINEEALNIINRAVPSLIVVGKHFKALLDDCEKKPFELIMNWKELNGVSKIPIGQRIGAVYKKINYFVQLMLLETRHTEE
jgi:hypothetical protein